MSRAHPLSAVVLLLFGLTLSGPGCNIFNDIGNAECADDPGMCDPCAGMGGAGGDDGEGGAGGDDGLGGTSDQGAGGAVAASAAATTGAGGAPGAGAGAGAGDSSGAGAGEGMGRSVPRAVPAVARAPRRVRRHHKGGENIGTAVSATCPAMAPISLPPPPPPPNWIGLDTGTLRNICFNNNVNGAQSQTGIAFNRTCGVAFETWVLKTMNQLPRWNYAIFSQERENHNQSNGGLPASVIPEKVFDQQTFTFSLNGGNVTWNAFQRSVFFEVKAVNGTLTPGASKWQILGFLDALTSFPIVPAGPHAPPAIMFTTTSNTAISSQGSPSVVGWANTWGVAVWQQIVYYNANSANTSNPTLSIGDPTSSTPYRVCLTPSLYPLLSYQIWPGPGPQNPLTWATNQEQDAVGAVPEPDPDSPALVP
jgi:hypothetical protein